MPPVYPTNPAPTKPALGQLDGAHVTNVGLLFTVRSAVGFSMWFTMVVVVVIAQAQPTPSAKWCFERGQQGAQLCENTETECIKLRSINTEIATSPCKRIEPLEIRKSPSEPSTPDQQAPTRQP